MTKTLITKEIQVDPKTVKICEQQFPNIKILKISKPSCCKKKERKKTQKNHKKGKNPELQNPLETSH